MIIQKAIVYIIVILMMILQIGCNAVNCSNPKNIDLLKKDTEKEVVNNIVDKEKVIMDEFNSLISKSTNVANVIQFIDKNISSISKENASVMIIKFEEIQKYNLPKLEDKFYNGAAIRKAINDGYQAYIDIEKIENVNSKELKDLLTETRDTGYKVETTEGLYFPIINYEFYKKYIRYVVPDIRDYINIMSVESNKIPAKDAGLIIRWDEVLKRALNQEKFIVEHENSVKTNDIRQLYKKYRYFVFYGLDNTPLFSFNSKVLIPEAKSAYLDAMKNNYNSNLLKEIGDFMRILEQYNYCLTDDVEIFRKSITET